MVVIDKILEFYWSDKIISVFGRLPHIYILSPHQHFSYKYSFSPMLRTRKKNSFWCTIKHLWGNICFVLHTNTVEFNYRAIRRNSHRNLGIFFAFVATPKNGPKWAATNGIEIPTTITLLECTPQFYNCTFMISILLSGYAPHTYLWYDSSLLRSSY